MGRASDSVLSVVAVALLVAVPEALGSTEVELAECLVVEDGAEDVELLAAVEGDAEFEGWEFCVEPVAAEVTTSLSEIEESVATLGESVVREGKLVSVVSCRLCTSVPGSPQTLPGKAHPSTVQIMI